MSNTFYSIKKYLLIFKQNKLAQFLSTFIILQSSFIVLFGKILKPYLQIGPGNRFDEKEDMIIC